MYSLSGSTVNLLTTLYGTTGNVFGISVSVSNGYMVVGASKLKRTRVRLLII